MSSKIKIWLSIFLLTMSALIIIGSLTFEKDEPPNALIQNLESAPKDSFDFPSKLQQTYSDDFFIVFNLKDIGCPTCLNEVVDYIDTVDKKFSKKIRIIIWTSTNELEMIKRSIERNVEFIDYPANKNYQMYFGKTKRYFFIDRKNKKDIKHLPLSSYTTPQTSKIEVLNYVLDTI